VGVFFLNTVYIISYHITAIRLAWCKCKSTSRPRYNKTVKNTPKTKKEKPKNKMIKQRADYLDSHIATNSTK